MTAPQPATPGSDSVRCTCKPWRGPGFHLDGCPRRPVAPSEPPAETQQDDERVLVDVDHEPYADAYEWEPLAARPSADTETLRRVRELVDEYAEPVPYGRQQFVAALRAALDGEWS